MNLVTLLFSTISMSFILIIGYFMWKFLTSKSTNFLYFSILLALNYIQTVFEYLNILETERSFFNFSGIASNLAYIVAVWFISRNRNYVIRPLFSLFYILTGAAIMTNVIEVLEYLPGSQERCSSICVMDLIIDFIVHALFVVFLINIYRNRLSLTTYQSELRLNKYQIIIGFAVILMLIVLSFNITTMMLFDDSKVLRMLVVRLGTLLVFIFLIQYISDSPDFIFSFKDEINRLHKIGIIGFQLMKFKDDGPTFLTSSSGLIGEYELSEEENSIFAIEVMINIKQDPSTVPVTFILPHPAREGLYVVALSFRLQDPEVRDSRLNGSGLGVFTLILPQEMFDNAHFRDLSSTFQEILEGFNEMEELVTSTELGGISGKLFKSMF